MSLKQKKIKFKPVIKLNHNIHTKHGETMRQVYRLSTSKENALQAISKLPTISVVPLCQ